MTNFGHLQTFAICECYSAALPEAVVRPVAQKFVCPILRIWAPAALRDACIRLRNERSKFYRWDRDRR